MDQVNALGISCIQFVQDQFSDFEDFIHMVNEVSNPYHVVQYMFPLLAAIDSVFAAQFLLCIGFGNWLNAVMKWWLLEDRPYWWVQSTTFYRGVRPSVAQYPETCETGPGSPSGHSATAASILILMVMWLSHVMHDRRWSLRWASSLVRVCAGGALLSVMLARVFVAAHFPHQTLLGAAVGLFLSPFLCIYVSDPYIFRYGASATRPVKVSMWWHTMYALLCVVVAALTYLALLAAGMDPMWTVHLAFRWCRDPSWIRVTSSPMYALVNSTASLLGAAITVTPEVASHRYYTKNRSLKISLLSSGLIFYALKRITDETTQKYSIHFLTSLARPALYLRVVPYLALKAGANGGRRRWLDDACRCYD